MLITNAKDYRFYSKYGEELRTIRDAFNKILKKLEKDRWKEEHAQRIYDEIIFHRLANIAEIIQGKYVDWSITKYKEFKDFLRDLSSLKGIGGDIFILKKKYGKYIVIQHTQLDMEVLERLIHLCKSRGYHFFIEAGVQYPGFMIRIKIW